MYAASLRAGAAMALEMGDRAFAEQCTALADRGRKDLVARMHNGEYFIHRPDPAHPEAINTNDGCHIDQVYGQSWVMQVGLERVVPETESIRALEALWQYNFTPDVGVFGGEHLTTGVVHHDPGFGGEFGYRQRGHLSACTQ